MNDQTLKQALLNLPPNAPEAIVPEVSKDSTTLNTLTVGELKDMAKKRGISGYSRKKKDELVELLSQ